MKRIIIELMLILLFVGLASAQAGLVYLGVYFDPVGCDHIYATNPDPDFPLYYESGEFKDIIGQIYAHQAEDTVPIYEYWHPECCDHFYTTNWDELGIGKNGWIYKNVLGFIYPNKKEWTVPLYRYWSQECCNHFYTTYFSESGFYTNCKGILCGYTYGGILGYFYPNYGISTVSSTDVPIKGIGDFRIIDPNDPILDPDGSFRIIDPNDPILDQEGSDGFRIIDPNQSMSR